MKISTWWSSLLEWNRPRAARRLRKRTGIELTPEGFAATSCFSPVSTSRPGIFACGAFVRADGYSFFRHTGLGRGDRGGRRALGSAIQPVQAEAVSAREVEMYRQRSLGSASLSATAAQTLLRSVNVHDVARYAQSLPNVVFVEKTLFACSQDSQELIRKRILEENLNRVVVAACTPRTHEPLFRETLRASGLNECLFEMANIRNQLAWVHAAQPEQATLKAKDLVRMAVAKAALLKPVPPVSVRITPQALVIGGGLAGMTAALALADQGFPVHLVEKAAQMGGMARHLFKTWKGEDIPSYMEMLAARVRDHNLITVHLKSAVTHAEGYVGSFRSTIQRPTGIRPSITA